MTGWWDRTRKSERKKERERDGQSEIETEWDRERQRETEWVCMCVFTFQCKCQHNYASNLVCATLRVCLSVIIQFIPSKWEVEVVFKFVGPFRCCMSIFLLSILFIQLVHILNRHIRSQELLMCVVFLQILRLVPRKRVDSCFDTVYSVQLSLTGFVKRSTSSLFGF